MNTEYQSILITKRNIMPNQPVACYCINRTNNHAKKSHKIADVLLTEHGDIVVSWHDDTERNTTAVLTHINDAINALKTLNPLQQNPAEKARQDMLTYAEENITIAHLFGRDAPFVCLSYLQKYVDEHMHDGYDYTNAGQPEKCIHFPETACNYPIEDCKNCPVVNQEFPFTTCTIE